MCPENGQFKWMSPFEIVNGEKLERIASNPNDPCCTENVDRIIELLPCRGRAGLGRILSNIELELAKSEFLQISLVAAKSTDTSGGQMILRIAFVTFNTEEGHVSIEKRLLRVDSCPAVSGYVENFPTPQISPITTIRSMMGTRNRPERIQGKLVVHFENRSNQSALVEYYEQLPFFLVPLWHTYSVAGNMDTNIPAIKNSDGLSTPTYMTWKFSLEPGQVVTISLDVYKKFIANYNFHFGFEKGFDLVGAIVSATASDGTSSTTITPGLTVVIPLPDGSATFNFLAVGCTSIAIFFGYTFRSVFPKRSIVIGTDEVAMAEKSPPIVQIIMLVSRWIKKLVQRIKSTSH
jgi:hypothetical protein